METKLEQITRKTLLYKSAVEYADYSLNHAEGCTHGCKYPCYAMQLKRRCGRVKSYDDWVKPKIVVNALELLDKELPRLKNKIHQVFLCFSTDPFMYQVKEMENLTLKILARLNRDKVKAVLISKGTYPESLTDTTLFNEDNEYGATIVSLSEDFRKKYEPQAASVADRIQALRKLHDAGLKTWVSIEPYPTPNIIRQDIREILSEISFVDKIVFGKWNYSSQISSFIHNKQFFNSIAYEVVKFCQNHSIEVHVKEGTIRLDCLASEHSAESKLLADYA